MLIIYRCLINILFPLIIIVIFLRVLFNKEDRSRFKEKSPNKYIQQLNTKIEQIKNLIKKEIKSSIYRNSVLIQEYEKMAKTHLNRYFDVLGNKPREPKAIETGIVLLIHQLIAALYGFLLKNCKQNLFGLALLMLESRPTKLKTTLLFWDE